MLLVEALSGATAAARDRLLDAGFDNVTVVIAGRRASWGDRFPRRRHSCFLRPT
jgi:hypothetical protein